MTDRVIALRKWPTLPVFGWAAFSGSARSDIPCILDTPNAAFTSSGSAAIALALENLGIGAGDAVLVPTYHCPTMVAPIVASGATPIFFPIDNDGSPVLTAIAALDLSHVRAMSVVHYFGFPQPMAKVRRFCGERGISLIEDCAHAMFGRSDEGDVGTFGDYAIGSLTKFFPVVDGGCLVSRSRPINVTGLRARGVTDQMRSAANSIEIGASYGAMSGVNRVIGAMFAAAEAIRGVRRNPQAAAGSKGNGLHPRANGSAKAFESAARASVWAHWVAHSAGRARIVALRRRNYQHMATLLARVPGTRVLLPTLPEGVVPYVFPLWVDGPHDVYLRMRAAGIPLFRWDDVWPGVPSLPDDCGPDWSIRVFQLACHQDLSLADLEAIVVSVRRILEGARS